MSAAKSRIKTILRGLARILPLPARQTAQRMRKHVIGSTTPPPPLPENYTDWAAILSSEPAQWKRAIQMARRGQHVLIATSVGGFTPGVFLEAALAVALTLRGARVHLLLCDEVLPACLETTVNSVPDVEKFARQGPPAALCQSCFSAASQSYSELGLPYFRYSDFLSAADRERARSLAQAVPIADIRTYRYDGLDIGENVYASAVRFFARSVLDDEPHSEAILRRYLAGAILSADVARRALQRLKIDVVVLHHGIYVPQGIIVEAARQAGTRFVIWHAAYRRQCFIFSLDQSYYSAFHEEPDEDWENMAWSAATEAALMSYLQSRNQGTRDWIVFITEPQDDLTAIAAELGIDFRRPWVGLLTNLMWDAQLFYPNNAFPSMLDWILETIDYFAERPDLQLIIRVHPAEIKNGNPTRQPVVPEIRKRFPVLPANIVIIPADSPISTYAVMRRCNAVLIYGTRTGLELACQGIPVIIAGEAWVRNKGFTYDVSSSAEYRIQLDRLPLPGPLEAGRVTRARKYAFHFYFRRMIPVEVAEPTGAWPPFKIKVSGLDDLRPGRHPGLDLICQGILQGRPFIYPAEEEFAADGSLTTA